MYCDVVHRLCIGKPPRNTSHHHANGRSRRRVGRYLRSLPEHSRRAIEVVSIDPDEAYRQAIHNELTGARIVVDHFHLVRGVTPRSTRFGASANATTGGAGRRARGARARALAGARDLYRVRQRLPGARERLTERERRRLCALFEREPLIAEAWALKQAFRSIYHAPDRHQAERRLDRFLAAVERAHSSRPSPPSPTRPALARRTARLPRRADHKPLRRGSHQQDQADQAPRPRTPSFDGLPERLLLACARTGPHGATPPDRREPNFRPAV
jgi:hypothetical protein